jgi:hypothetical protein
MHVDVRRPDRVRFWLRSHEPPPSSPSRVGLELIVRGLATGFGIGLLLMVGAHAIVAELAVIGVIAIGVALLSWEA